jgi:hypothetical protein
MDIKHGIFFNFKNEIIRLPVNPETITVKKESNNKTYQVLKLGEINILGDVKLSEIKFDIILPGRIYPFVVTKNDFQNPDFYIEKFEEYYKSKEPVRLIITGDPMGINQLVSIENIDSEKRAGEDDDIYVKLELKEYREYGLNTYVPINGQSGEIKKVYIQNSMARPNTKPKITDYVVQNGEDFYLIAKRLTGDGSNAIQVAQYNGMNVLDKPIEGQVIKWK